MPKSITGFCPVRSTNFLGWLFENTPRGGVKVQIEINEKNKLVRASPSSYNLRPRRKQISYAEAESDSDSERDT